MRKRFYVGISILIILVLAFVIGTYFGGVRETPYEGYPDQVYTPAAKKGMGFEILPQKQVQYTPTATLATPEYKQVTGEILVQRLKKDYYITIQDDDPISVAEAIKKKVSSLNGYVITEELSKSKSLTVYYIEFRIPNDAASEGEMGALLKSFNVKELRLESEDVTSRYNQIIAEIQSLEEELKHLQEFYSKAEDVNDLMNIERRISEVNSRLNYLYLQKDYYEKVTDYITYHVRIESREEPVFEAELNLMKTIYQAVYALILIIRGLIALIIISLPFVGLYLLGKTIYKKYYKAIQKEKE